MPGKDGTGPLGQGSMTGRGAGYCKGYSAPSYRGAGYKMGVGRGFGWRRFTYAAPVRYPYPGYPQANYQPTKEEEAAVLENQIKALEREQQMLNEEVGNVKQRLDELRSQE